MAGGWLNGFIVAKVRVNALITTLGTLGIFRGVAILIGGPGITFLPQSFSQLGQARFLGVQSPVWLMLGLAVVFQYLMSQTRFFRQYYYIGSNEKAATLSGINVARMRMLAFTVMACSPASAVSAMPLGWRPRSPPSAMGRSYG